MKFLRKNFKLNGNADVIVNKSIVVLNEQRVRV